LYLCSIVFFLLFVIIVCNMTYIINIMRNISHVLVTSPTSTLDYYLFVLQHNNSLHPWGEPL